MFSSFEVPTLAYCLLACLNDGHPCQLVTFFNGTCYFGDINYSFELNSNLAEPSLVYIRQGIWKMLF
jgi:hypothetical protein